MKDQNDIVSSERNEENALNEKLNQLKAGDVEEAWDDVVSNLRQKATVLPIRPEDVDYLLRQWAFLEIVDGSTNPDDGRELVKFIPLSCGWILHDHGSILRASPGHLAFGPYWAGSDEDESGSTTSDQTVDKILVQGKGTVVQQYVDAAWSMVQLAEERWSFGKITAGYRPMKWAAYIYAESREYLLDGFAPSRQERQLYTYIQKLHRDKLRKQAEITRMPR